MVQLLELPMVKPALVRTLVAISLGAIAGALSRYFFASFLTERLGTSFPFGTWIVNLTGCFGMGAFTSLAIVTLTISPEVRLAVTTGFLGSYTTFSSYELETVKLLQMGAWGTGSLYWVSSILLGLISFYLGVGFMEWILAQRNTP